MFFGENFLGQCCALGNYSIPIIGFSVSIRSLLCGCVTVCVRVRVHVRMCVGVCVHVCGYYVCGCVCLCSLVSAVW